MGGARNQTKAPGRRGSARKPAARGARADERVAGISDAAVREKTGKTWKQWCGLLDRAGASELAHKDIAVLLHEDHGLSGWWSQMVTVGYEQARGLRQKGQRCDGDFQISGSKTVGVPVARLYRAFATKTARARWLPDPELEVRKATKEKSMRVTWVDGVSDVSVYFWDKGSAKSQVTLQHGKLKSSAQGERMKAYWKKALAALKEQLEG